MVDGVRATRVRFHILVLGQLHLRHREGSKRPRKPTEVPYCVKDPFKIASLSSIAPTIVEFVSQSGTATKFYGVV